MIKQNVDTFLKHTHHSAYNHRFPPLIREQGHGQALALEFQFASPTVENRHYDARGAR